MSITRFDCLAIVFGLEPETLPELGQNIMAGGSRKKLILLAASPEFAEQATGEIINAVKSGTDLPQTGFLPQKAILIEAPGGQKAGLKWIERFKKNCPQVADFAFALVTSTGKTWTLARYARSVAAEHQLMKTRKPQDNPDFKLV